MINNILEPFSYHYMVNAMWVSALVGSLCGFLSCYLIFRGWSLIGDALSHSITPGIAIAYMLGLPFSLCAFIAGSLATIAMLFFKTYTTLKESVIIGLIFSFFFGCGLFIISLSPTSVNIHTIILGNLLAITPNDSLQLLVISVISLSILSIKWKDFLVIFFDESHASSIGLHTTFLKIIFFTLLSIATVAALQTVGSFLVISMLVTPGATGYLLTDKFSNLLFIAISIGSATSFVGTYISYFLDGATGGIIILLQTAVFLITLLIAPKHGIFHMRHKS
ncbi:MAG: manganese/iron transport system permease protein [Candidatus Tokpelaia sp. JSC161]|jgi:manganese/iron transport system permease protein|nr:MAG: manganese/iron transport system permease protein [Candidatus Tokpelaia sp. JSC161]